MHKVLTVLLLSSTLFTALAQPPQWITYTDSVKNAWGAPDSKLLKPQERDKFAGVHYLPYDSAYCLSVRYVPNENPDTLKIPTTRKKTSRYLNYGKVNFTLQGTECVLAVYRGLDPWSEMDLYFVMFNDLTNGDTSYGGGRYLELQHVDESAGTAVLDFNYSYNPYCAYSARYSCPIPPPENRLAFEVNAGVGY